MTLLKGMPDGMPELDIGLSKTAQPVRVPFCQRQRLRQAARFCSVFSTVCNQFRPGRQALSAPNYRTVMRRRWREWDIVSETTAFAVAA